MPAHYGKKKPARKPSIGKLPAGKKASDRVRDTMLRPGRPGEKIAKKPNKINKMASKVKKRGR